MNHLAAEDFVARLHVGQIEVRGHVGEERQECVPDAVPVEHHAARIPFEPRSEHHLGMSVEDRLDQLRILFRVVFEVGILDENDVPAGFLDAATDRGAFSLVDRLENVPDLRPLIRQRGDHVLRSIGRLVVDDDDLLVDRNFLDPAQQLRHRGPLVVAGDDHR